jgi:hypothetical protein
MSLSTSPLVCHTSLVHVPGVSLSLSPLQTSSHYLRVSPHLAFSLRDAYVICLHKTHTHFLSLYRVLSPPSLSLSLSLSVCTPTLSPSHTHTIDLSLVRCSLRSIAYRFFEKSNLTKFDQVCEEKYLELERQTYIIRFITWCSFMLNLFGNVEINKFLDKLGQSFQSLT